MEIIIDFVSEMPWNVMPVLEEDGKKLSQSITILRYLGRKLGIAPTDLFELAKTDEYIDAMLDVRPGL
jgi:glutathione S-transferase